MSFSAEEVVQALYSAVLNRDPDPLGLKAYSDLLTQNPNVLSRVAKTIFNSDEHKNVFGITAFINDHSQFGEFLILLKHFLSRDRKHGIVVDVGARGKERSNSFDLAKTFGWKALLVEANPNLWESIESDFIGTDFILEKSAVSDTDGIMPFFIGVNDDVSSLNKANTAAWGDILEEKQVVVRKLGAILDEYEVPKNFEVLSIDIEGHDVRVLNDLIETTQYRPEVVIIETSMDFKWFYPGDIGVTSAVISTYKLGYQTRANMILTRINSPERL